MGNKTEEVEIEKELDKLDEQEIEINLELYKLQTEVNNYSKIINGSNENKFIIILIIYVKTIKNLPTEEFVVDNKDTGFSN